MKRILIPVSEHLFGATGIISILLPKLRIKSNSDQLNSCLLVFPELLCKQSIHIDPDLDPWTDFPVWPRTSLITTDLPDGHWAAWPTLITITGPNPDPDSLTCTPSSYPGSPLPPQTCPMTWTLAWTWLPPLGLPFSPYLATVGLSPGWWPASPVTTLSSPPLGSCWPSLLPDNRTERNFLF